MLGKYEHWLAFKLINLGITLLPEHFKTETLISNCMKTGHIKVNKDKNKPINNDKEELPRLEKRVIRIIAETLGMPEEGVHLNSTEETLEMDSLDSIEVVMAVEEHFDIEISDITAEGFNTVSDIVEFVAHTY